MKMLILLLIGNCIASTSFLVPEPSTNTTTYHTIFGGDWYTSDTITTSKPTYSDTAMTLDIPDHTSWENKGWATHFDGVKLEVGKTVYFKMGWMSYGYEAKKCEEHYWITYAWNHECFDDSGKLADGCYEDVHCLVNTGDIRMVLEDSNGHQITKDNVGTLKAQ